MTHMTNAATRDAAVAELSVDERRARMATTAATVQAAHDGFLHRSLKQGGFERRGLLQRLVKSN